MSDNTVIEPDDLFGNEDDSMETEATATFSNADLEVFINENPTEMSALFKIYMDNINAIVKQVNMSIKNEARDTNARWSFSKSKTNQLIISDGTYSWTFTKDSTGETKK